MICISLIYYVLFLLEYIGKVILLLEGYFSVTPPSPRLCVVSLFSWSVKPACTPLTKSEEKVRLPTV